jgi:hypothetical protein
MGKTFRKEKSFRRRPKPYNPPDKRKKNQDVKYYGGMSWREIKELLESEEE